MVIFLYNLYIFVWIQHGCLANMVFAFDPSNSVKKRLWFISISDNLGFGQSTFLLFLLQLQQPLVFAEGTFFQHLEKPR